MESKEAQEDAFSSIIDEINRKGTNWNGIATELFRAMHSNKLSHDEYSALSAIEIAVIGGELSRLNLRLDKLEKATKNILIKVSSR